MTRGRKNGYRKEGIDGVAGRSGKEWGGGGEFCDHWSKGFSSNVGEYLALELNGGGGVQ